MMKSIVKLIMILEKSAMKNFGIKSLLPVLLLLATLYPLPARAGLTDFKTIKMAQDAYKAKDYNRTIHALSHLKTPSPERHFDLGDAYYKAGKLDQALRAYKRAKGGSVDEEKRLHNIGNVYFKKKQYDHAITAYESALKIHDDPDTRFNLELAKKMKKKQEQKKKKKKQQQKKNQKKQQKNKQNKKNKHNQKKNQNKQSNKNKKSQKNNKKNSQNKPNDKQGKQPKKKPQDKPGDTKKKPQNKTGKQNQKKKPEQKKGDKQSQSQSKPGKPKQKKKPEKAQGSSRAKATQAQKIQAKEIKRLMKQLKGKKMQPRLYQFVGKKHHKPNPSTVNPW